MAQASAEKLEHTEPADKERVASVSQREQYWQERRSRLCQKKRNKGVCPEYQIMGGGGESQGGREPHLDEREGDQSESMEWKG